MILIISFMKQMPYWMYTLVLSFLLMTVIGVDAYSQDRDVGGQCEGCEAVFEYGAKKLTWVDTLPDFREPGPKLEISGTIFQRDGKTPAKDVILYIYHTDQKGEYSRKGNESGWGLRHGYIRGWIKTGADGKYKFYTLKPAAYPGGGNPSHIHATIKEPGLKEYWIGEYLFEDDPILTAKDRQSDKRNRCGPGIVTTHRAKTGMLTARRDLVLGLNVPGY
jgi:protocatechuate 3,4-dioxygenase beta subunit